MPLKELWDPGPLFLFFSLGDNMSGFAPVSAPHHCHLATLTRGLTAVDLPDPGMEPPKPEAKTMLFSL
jgi:hypothetical protein